MRSAASIVREARTAAGLTQAELARRMGTTQSAVARLEAKGANPRLRTLEKAVRAAGRHLELDAPAFPSGSIDESLTAGMLRRSPSDRLRTFESFYAETRDMALAARKSRGHLA
jgi:transcriptional regulator with XRE-family HTH domain